MKTTPFSFRLLYDPRLRRLHASERWVFLALLFLAGEKGKLALGNVALNDQDFADQAGVTLEEASRALERFFELGLLERQDGALLLSPDWYLSASTTYPQESAPAFSWGCGEVRPSSTERVRRHRRKVIRKENEGKERLSSSAQKTVLETQNETFNETSMKRSNETLKTSNETQNETKNREPEDGIGSSIETKNSNETVKCNVNETLHETQNETSVKRFNETPKTRYMKRSETLNETRSETLGEAPFRLQEAKVGAQFQQILKQAAFLPEEENEQKEKEERSKEEREREFLSLERKNAFSPEREKEKESREGGKEETPLLSFPLPPSALQPAGEGEPPPERASPEGEGSLNSDEDPAPSLESRAPHPEGGFKGQKEEPVPYPERDGAGEGPHLLSEGGRTFPDEPVRMEGEDGNLSLREGLLEATFFKGKKAGSAPSHGPPARGPARAKEPFSYPQDFETFWSAYPRRIEKRRAFRAWQARLREGISPETLINCARNYAEYVLLKGTAECYIKHPATFLGPDRPFEDWREKRRDKATIPKFSRAAQVAMALAEKYEREEDGGEDLNLLSL
ncbi:MAG: hypothetical protein QMD88_03115 [Coprothermobacterota bacterium]|nr:hypothetical protein [Coprothermobacterota bacterium]